jgi:hypothetical protein
MQWRDLVLVTSALMATMLCSFVYHHYALPAGHPDALLASHMRDATRFMDRIIAVILGVSLVCFLLGIGCAGFIPHPPRVPPLTYLVRTHLARRARNVAGQ